MIDKTLQASGRRKYNEINVLIKVWTECCEALREDLTEGVLLDLGLDKWQDIWGEGEGIPGGWNMCKGTKASTDT